MVGPTGGGCGTVAAVVMAAVVALGAGAPVGTNHEQAAPWSNATRTAFFMRQAIGLAKEAVREGGAPFGALIVDPVEDAVVVVGKNHAGQNPLWHGEMDAMNALAAQLAPRPVFGNAGGLELYTTAEPCPMCAAAVVWSGFGRVVFGSSIAYLETYGTHQMNITATAVVASADFGSTVVDGGVLHNETDPLYTNLSMLHHH
mmetsp:Transcript_4487/g.11454  ORF Transcript_4487/g.11454 Transcript_4487/m.11454 type:complete len:201 (-) Transcript_4487:270-872(-)